MSISRAFPTFKNGFKIDRKSRPWNLGLRLYFEGFPN